MRTRFFGGALAIAIAAHGIGCGADEFIPDRPDARVETPPPDAGLPWPPAASEWPSFGRDDSNSRANDAETAIAPDTVANLELAWEYTEAAVTSTPTIVAGVVYFGSWDGVVHARDAVDGTEVWRRDVGAGVSATVLVTEHLVYVTDADGYLHALSRRSGATEWSVELAAHEDANLFSSPVLVDDLIVVGVSSTELARILDDYTFRGSVVALDAFTGEERWRVYTTENDATAGAGVSVWSSAAVDRALGLVYIGTGNTYEEPASPLSDALLAIDYATGEIAWSRQFTEGDVFTIFMDPPTGPDADIGDHPNLFTIGDRDVVGVGDKAGTYCVLDRATGETVWGAILEPGSPLGGVMAATAVAHDTVFVNTNVWMDLAQFDDPTNTSELYALDAATGDTRWQTSLDAPSFGGMSWANGVLFLGTIDGTIHAFDAATGDELWSDALAENVGGGSAVVDGRLYTGFGYAFLTNPTDVPGGLRVYQLPP